VKILVTGGRDFTDEAYINSILDRVNRMWGITCLVHGRARGVDYICGQWAGLNNIRVKEYGVTKADYDRFGPRAPIIRNSTMLENESPDLVIVFPGGNGTRDMKEKAIKDNRFVLEVHPTNGNRVFKPLEPDVDFMAYMKEMSSKNDGNTRRNKN
jgi:hypothetical protein